MSLRRLIDEATTVHSVYLHGLTLLQEADLRRVIESEPAQLLSFVDKSDQEVYLRLTGSSEAHVEFILSTFCKDNPGACFFQKPVP